MPNYLEILDATLRLATFDVLTGLPDRQAYKQIREEGLTRFLPSFIDWEAGEIRDEEAFEREVDRVVTGFPTPRVFIAYQEREEELPITSFADLNYLLLEEALDISPDGKIGFPGYCLATGRANRRVGNHTLRRLFTSVLEGFTDPNRQRYEEILISSDWRWFDHYHDVLRTLNEATTRATQEGRNPSGVLIVAQRGGTSPRLALLLKETAIRGR